MILYPSSETKTPSTSAPWGGIALAVLACLGYVLVTLPAKGRFERGRAALAQQIDQALEADFKSGQLAPEFWEKTKEDLAIVGLARNREIFSEEARRLYREMESVPLPLVHLEGAAPIKKLAMMIAPHHWGVLLAGLVAILLMSYLFEHLYDRQVTLSLFFLSAALWVVLEPYVPNAYWPSPIFAWSNATLVYLLVGWFTSPRARVYVTFRGWLGTLFRIQAAVPTICFPVLFLAAMFAVNLLHPGYKAYFEILPLMAVLLQAILFAAVMAAIPSKITVVAETTEDMANRQLSAAELLLNEDRFDEGMNLLHTLLTSSPTVGQIRKITSLAWENDNVPLARQGYDLLLKRALNSQDFLQVAAVIEEMLFRNLPVPGPPLCKVVAMGLSRSMFDMVRKLLPFMHDHEEIDEQTVVQTYLQFVTKLLAQKEPDRQYLHELRTWLEEHYPDAAVLKPLREFFSQAGPASVVNTYSHLVSIYKYVDIKLVAIEPGQLRLLVRDKEQHAPWTAVVGCFGCYAAGKNKGFRGCILIKFRRRIFACSFYKSDILIKEGGLPLTFEQTWELLQRHTPEDLPFLIIEDFPKLDDETRYEGMVARFINLDRVQKETV